MSSSFELCAHGITVKRVLRNPSPALLYEEAIRHDVGTTIADSGADRVFRREDGTFAQRQTRRAAPAVGGQYLVGPVNFPLDEPTFMINRERAKDYLNTLDRLYVIDAFAGWDPKYRMKVRVICSRVPRAVHAQHADPADRRRVGGLRSAGLRDLQRRPLSRESLHHRDDVAPVWISPSNWVNS